MSNKLLRPATFLVLLLTLSGCYAAVPGNWGDEGSYGYRGSAGYAYPAYGVPHAREYAPRPFYAYGRNYHYAARPAYRAGWHSPRGWGRGDSARGSRHWQGGGRGRSHRG